MITVGIDLVETGRIKKSVENERFIRRVYGENEINELKKRKFPVQSMAAAFAGKEAFLKAVGSGLGSCKLSEIELLHKPSGQPYLALSGKAKEIAENMNMDFSVSLTHTRQYASAVVAGEKRVHTSQGGENK